MNVLIVFSCLVVAIMAKPQGYAYSQPPTAVEQPAVYQTQPTYQAPPTVVEQPAVYQTQPTYQAPIVTSTVHKHVYVHVPPVDHEELAEQQSLAPIINHQKHYKIIFIKAPTSPSHSQQLVQQQQNINEEKTLVYVLVKKPESLSDIQQTQPQVNSAIFRIFLFYSAITKLVVFFPNLTGSSSIEAGSIFHQI